MNDVLLEKISNIEKMIIELNTKIDNFLGYEEMTEEELKEVEEIRKEVKRGDYVRFDWCSHKSG